MSAPGRSVLHVDMDAFYASVEARERPELAGRPLVVGGTGNRGVVCSASYEARAYGVRSAMPAARARRLCPRATFVAPRFALYHRYSEQFHEILLGFTPLVEGIGLDEAFLDVTGCGALFGAAGSIGGEIRRLVRERLGLACSVGAGPSKLVAKLASKAAKPTASRQGPVPGAGLVVVGAEEVTAFLWPLPVDALWGVGRVATERLHRLGVTTIGDLAAVPVSTLVAGLGRSGGQLLHELAWGRDDRPVEAGRAPKSIGHEETYEVDLYDADVLERRLVAMADSVASRARKEGLSGRTVTLKVRYSDFSTVTRSHTFAGPQANGHALWTAAQAMLGALSLERGVRLLGVSISGLVPASASPGEQLELELAPGDLPPGPQPAGAGWDRASRAVDAVRARFGGASVRPGAALSGRRPPRASGVDRSRSVDGGADEG